MLLNILNLSVAVRDSETLHDKMILSNVNVKVGRGEIVALVGASGSGKSTAALSAMKLLPPELKIKSGQVLWKGEDILAMTPAELRRVRGADIAMIFQEPLYAFNPLFLIEEQIDEALRAHQKLDEDERQARIIDLLVQAGVRDAQRVMKSYPHQLSGGLRQRAMIAQALAGKPKLIIADEPTSSIDVTLQAKVMELFFRLKKNLGISFLLITHDFGVVRHLADRVYIMRQGEVIESGDVSEIFMHPREDYTCRLIEATGEKFSD
ncbi:MAG: ABC transporter ATP-binding protein [Candidatus Omnitrophota bacterium]